MTVVHVTNMYVLWTDIAAVVISKFTHLHFHYSEMETAKNNLVEYLQLEVGVLCQK